MLLPQGCHACRMPNSNLTWFIHFDSQELAKAASLIQPPRHVIAMRHSPQPRGLRNMNGIKAPRSMRGFSGYERASQTAAGVGLVAAVCIATAGPGRAQGTQLPTVTMEAPAAPKAKKRPPRQTRAATRPVIPRPASQPVSAPQQQAAPAVGGGAANANPYANAGAPYKVERSANSRITEPLINTPRTVTTIPKEVLADKGATSVRELVRTTPGLTLGTGEGGNAFGDRVFIRGFDARNDMYINGVRESGVSMRETFMTEQVEVIKGPAGTIGGRGTAGGAVNRAGSVCLNSFGAFLKWIPASVMPPSGWMAAH